MTTRLCFVLAFLPTLLTVNGCGRIEFESLPPDDADIMTTTGNDSTAPDSSADSTEATPTDNLDTGTETDRNTDEDTNAATDSDTETAGETETGSDNIKDTDTDSDTNTGADTDTGVDTDTGADSECPTLSDTDYVEILGAADFEGFSCFNTVTCTAVTASPPDASFSQAWRAEYWHIMTKPSFSQLQHTIDSAIDTGDHLLLEFWTRCVSDTCRTGVLVEQSVSPWTNFIEYYTTADSNWALHQVPFVAQQSFAAGETQITFRLGYAGQTIEIYPKRIINYGAIDTVQRSECLPNTTNLYDSISFGYAPPPVDVSYVKADDIGNWAYLLNVEVNSRPPATITAAGYPAWLSWDSTTNALSGTPTTAELGLSPMITIEAENEFGAISYQYRISVEIEP